MHRATLAAIALVLLVPTAAAAQVRVLGGFYEPAMLQVEPLESITFTNEDTAPHTVTSTWDGGRTFDIMLKSGDAFVHSFDAPGTYAIHCRPHATANGGMNTMEGMVMTIRVGPMESAAADMPAPAFALVLIALVGAGALLRRRA